MHIDPNEAPPAEPVPARFYASHRATEITRVVGGCYPSDRWTPELAEKERIRRARQKPPRPPKQRFRLRGSISASNPSPSETECVERANDSTVANALVPGDRRGTHAGESGRVQSEVVSSVEACEAW